MPFKNEYAQIKLYASGLTSVFGSTSVWKNIFKKGYVECHCITEWADEYFQ